MKFAEVLGRRNIFYKVVGWVFATGIIVLIFILNPTIWSELNRLKRLSLFNITLFSLIFLVTQFLLGIEIKLLCRPLGIDLKLAEWFGLVSIRSYGNYLPLNAGTIANALLLKKTAKLPITKFTALTVFMMATMYSISSFIGSVIIVYNLIVGNLLYLNLAPIFLLIFFSSTLFLLLPLPSSKGDSRFLFWIRSINQGWNTIRNNRVLLFSLYFVRIIIIALICIRMWVIILVMGYSPDIGTVVLLSCGLSILKIGSIVPGNIGVREAISGWITKSVGNGFEYGFITIAVDRIIQTAWILLLGYGFSIYFSRKISSGAITKVRPQSRN